MPSMATRLRSTKSCSRKTATEWVKSPSRKSRLPTRKSERVWWLTETPPASHRKALWLEHSQARARALPTASRVAYSHSATQTLGSMAGCPGPPTRERTASYKGARSRPQQKSQTRRAWWSVSRRSSRGMQGMTWLRSAVRNLGAGRSLMATTSLSPPRSRPLRICMCPFRHRLSLLCLVAPPRRVVILGVERLGAEAADALFLEVRLGRVLLQRALEPLAAGAIAGLLEFAFQLSLSSFVVVH